MKISPDSAIFLWYDSESVRIDIPFGIRNSRRRLFCEFFPGLVRLSCVQLGTAPENLKKTWKRKNLLAMRSLFALCAFSASVTGRTNFAGEPSQYYVLKKKVIPFIQKKNF